jgi:dTDP-glucose pyrophosphorylase
VVLDGEWSDVGTFGSFLRAGMIVKKHREKKEGTTDKHRFIIITLLIYFSRSPTPANCLPHNLHHTPHIHPS